MTRFKPALGLAASVSGNHERHNMKLMDNDKKVADVLKATATNIVEFVRFEVGEGIEKKAEMSFAEEVAAAQAAAK